MKESLIAWLDADMMTAILLALELVPVSEKLKNIDMMAKRINSYSYQYPRGDQEIIAKLSDPSYEVGNYVLPDDASVEDKFKYEICQTILACQQENKISYEKLAKRLDLPFAKAMQVLKGRINNFSLTELMNCLERLVSSCQVKIFPTQLKSDLA